MLTRSLLHVSVALAVLGAVSAVPAWAAHGGGGGGGGMHGGGGGGSMHFSPGAGSSMHFSPGAGSSMHFNPGAGNSVHFSQSYNSSHFQNFTGNSSNYIHSGNANWSNGPHGQNFQSMHHPNGGTNWGHNDWGHNNWGHNDWGHHDWDHHFWRPYWGPGWNTWGYWGFPFWFSYWNDYPFGWGGFYADYFCPYGSVYASGYPADVYNYPSANDGQYAANFAPSPAATASDYPPADEGGASAGNEGLQYYNEARDAFTRGDYRNSLRLAGHSGVESPQNSKVHELISLALFASGEYRGAATEAHAALALGPPSDWASLYSYYNDADKYTEQLRKLEKAVADVPNSAPAHFLLGYHYLMTGAKEEAKDHLAQAAKLTPNDKLAQHILSQLESHSAITPPQLPKQPEGAKGKLL